MLSRTLVVTAALTLSFVSCGPVTSKCDQTTCTTGCCDLNDVCQPPSTLACGASGSACNVCVGSQLCSFGFCISPGGGSTGGGSGSTGGGTSTGGGSATGGGSETGGGSATGGGTNTGGGSGSCTPGGTCSTNPSRPCILGVVSCVGGAATCVDSTTFAAEGTSCGSNQTCDAFGTCRCAGGALSCAGQCVQCSTPANAVPSCNGATCDFTCNTGFHRCGSQCLSDNSVNSCGTSCTPCSSSGGTPVCNAGQCGISSCNSGFLLCGGACAQCGTPANATSTCNGSSCGFECNPGRGLCNGVCVVCNTPENAYQTCNGSTCDFECHSGFERVGQSCLRPATWKLSSAAAGPAGRYGAPMTYDSARSRVVLWGGHSTVNGSFVHRNDTWEFNGTAWASTGGSTKPPLPATGVIVNSIVNHMAYDVARARTVLLSGNNGTSTWEYNGSTWTQAFPTTTPGYSSTRLSYDPVNGRVIAVTRGTNSLETWSWTGSTWTLISNSGPTVTGFALATDTLRNRVMLFGGLATNMLSSATNDLWEWNGSSWTKRTVTGTLPPIQHNSVMAFDKARNKLVVVGEDNQSYTWEFDGTSWSFFVGPVYYGDVPSMAYDESRQVTVLFGGVSAATATDLYELKR